MSESEDENEGYRKALQVRIDECKRTLKRGKTDDPTRPFFCTFALEAIIGCHTRLIHRLDNPQLA